MDWASLRELWRREYDYVFVTIGDALLPSFSEELLAEEGELTEYSVYAVEKSSGRLRLVRP